MKEILTRMDFRDSLVPGPFFARDLEKRTGLAGDSAPAPPVDASRLLFFDTETTGLSTGAGTIIFACGLGRFVSPGEFRLRLFFLSDYPGEAAFLARIAGEFKPDDLLVSYNGASFDIPLMRTRFVMQAMRVELPAHLDLLVTARRLWGGRRVAKRKNPVPGEDDSGARLSRIERVALGRERVDDLPGSLAPERYFSWLRDHEWTEIEPVLAHNAQDILSLPEILKRAAALIEGDEAADGNVDLYRLSQIRRRGCEGAEWLPLMESAARSGDRRALVWLSVYFQREGELERARGCWTLLASGPSPHPVALRKLARYALKRGRIEESLKWYGFLLAALPEGEKRDRVEALMEKLNKVKILE